MTVNDLTKMLLSNKFNNSKTSSNIKNNENFVTNYYKKTDEETNKEVSFKTEKAE